MLLRDVRILDNVQILSENKNDGTMKIRGLFQRADEANQNKRRYPKKIMESAVTNLQDMINDNRLCGELDHPNYEIVKLKNASHRITKLKCEGNDVIGEAVILPTPAGQVAQQLIRGGVKLGISSRGTGSVSEGKDGISEVNDDYKMITFDLVADPSVHDAFPSLTESVDPGQSKIVESTMKQVHGESVFLQLLENKLDEYSQEGDPSPKEVNKTKKIMRQDIKSGMRTKRGRILDNPKPKISRDIHDRPLTPDKTPKEKSMDMIKKIHAKRMAKKVRESIKQKS